MINNIQIDEKQEHIVASILNRHLSSHIKVWVFGSRATFKAKPYSDLDIALESKHGVQIDHKIITKLEHDFEESELPWKVDVICIDDVSQDFRKIIDHDKTPFILEGDHE